MHAMAKDLGSFYDNLATMLHAGVDIRRAVPSAAAGSRRMKAAAEAVGERVARGASLADAMAGYPRAFPRADVRMFAVAEETGRIAEICKDLAAWYAFKRKLVRIVIAGVVYPFVMIHIAALILPLLGLVLGKYGLPGFLLRAIGTLAIFYVPIGLLYLLYRAGGGDHPLRAVLDRVMLRVPVLGGALRDLAVSRFCRSYHAMMEAGAKADASCEAAARLCGNRLMQARFIGGATTAAKGRAVYEGFSRQLPVDFRVAWENGEESGRLAETVERLANEFTDRAEFSFGLVAAWIPRMIYGLIALYFVFSILRLAMSMRGLYGV